MGEEDYTLFRVEATKNTPDIIFDPDQKIYKVEGRSLPENAISFYEPVINWLRNYDGQNDPQIFMVFKIDYFNTPSAKPILDILKVMDELKEKGLETKVSWYYRHDDDDMREVGEEYSDFISTTIELISY